MAFLKRLGFYLAGLSLGLIFLAFFLKKKSEETGVSFCYLPNCRVLKDLRTKTYEFSPDLQQRIQSNQLDTTGLGLLFTEGSINFDESNPRNKPCGEYKLEGTINQQEVSILLKSCKDKVLIEAID